MSSSLAGRWARIRLSLRAKLYTGFLLFAAAGLAAGGILVERSVRSSAEADIRDRLAYETTMLGQMTANALFGEIDPSDTSLSSGVRALGEAVQTELEVIAKNGTVVADSASDHPLSLPLQDGAPEIVDAREGESGAAVRNGRVFVARAIRRDERLLGFARSSVPLEVIDRQVRDVRTRLLYGALPVLLIAIIVGYLFTARLVRPMVALFAAAKRVGEGDLEQMVAVTSKDEIAELSTAFNGVIGNLRQTITKLDDRNREMRLVLDHVGQGLLTVDRAGQVSAERSAAVDEWFGRAAPGTTYWDYLAPIDTAYGGMFRCAWEELLEEVMPFEVAFAQLPRVITAGPRAYEVGYTPLRGDGEGDGFAGMLIMISDVTTRIAAERAESEQREIVSALERVMKDKPSFLEFLTEAQGLVDALCRDSRPEPAAARRLLHTLKGNASTFGLGRFAARCHEVEQRLAGGAEDLSEADRRVLSADWTGLVERLRAILSERADSGLDVDEEDWEGLLRAIVEGAPRSEIIRRLTEWKLERVAHKLRRFASQGRDLAVRLGKGDIEVTIRADRLRLSRPALAPFWASLTHVVRNAVDHGLEYPEERIRAGKSTPARLMLEAHGTKDGVTIAVSDDGRGIDWEGVRRRAEELGLRHATRADLIEALFQDGFSTRGDVSEVSGRGLGLGVARAECERLGGTAAVASESGAGTTVRFTFPRERVSPAEGRSVEMRASERPSADCA